ncbi:MAG: mucoidy inhibitor MuiA family protein [Ignavibacteria bacterium]|nr:mucoidy inhibitor MuiA family protein [Ignavibacteria bacterium]
MKKYILLLFIPSICFAQLKPVESKVIEATVFKDRAMVTRSADVNLQKGENTIVFSELTTDIKDESVRISAKGNGEIKILDVKVERRFTAEIREEKINELQKKIDELNREMQISTDQLAVYDSKKSFIESLKAESVKYANQKILISTNSTKEWNDLLKFIDTNLNEIYKGIREESKKRAALDPEIRALKLTIDQTRKVEQRNFKEIIVKIDAAENSKAKIEASYIVNSANWYPIYDARVSSKTKQLELSFFAMMQQSTGEDWKDVKLTFSTADPLSVKSLPKLDTWFLDVNPLPQKKVDVLKTSGVTQGNVNISYDQNFGLPKGQGAITGYVTDAETGEPLIGANVILEGTSLGSATDVTGKFYLTNIPAASYNLKASFVGYESYSIRMNVVEKNVANLNLSLAPSKISVGEVVVTSTRPLIQKSSTNSVRITTNDENDLQKDFKIELPVYSDVKAKDLSTTFELNTKNTIPSDNSPHKVTIAISNLPIEFSYTAIPKILPKVYLKGKVFNKNEYPLLEGEINIFVDNDFVNRTYMTTIVPTDTFEIALGIDESILCEKKLINRFLESKGLFGGSRSVTYDFEIKVINNRKTEESISVFDQLPVVMNEKIKIELITPSEKEVKLNQNHELVWQLKLNPGETKLIPLKFTVEFPNNVNVFGLE